VIRLYFRRRALKVCVNCGSPHLFKNNVRCKRCSAKCSKSVTAFREKKMLSGLCGQSGCYRIVQQGKQSCRYHLRKFSKDLRARKAAGICISPCCGGTPQSGRSLCDHCALKSRIHRMNVPRLEKEKARAAFKKFLGRCACCKSTDPGYSWCVDHCHVRKIFRGIICWPCNQTLGQSHDSPKRLRMCAGYLEGDFNG
jgi:hypothetical protein